MLKLFKKIVYSSILLFLLSGTAFACINDEYTAHSETLWWESYEDTFVINMITISVVVLLIPYLFYKVYSPHKSQLSKSDLYFTFFMSAVTISMLVSRVIYSIGPIMWISMLLLLWVYLLVFIFAVWWFIRDYIKSYTLQSKYFVFVSLFYLIYLITYVVCGIRGVHLNGDSPLTIILILLTLMIPLYAFFSIKDYKFKIYSISVFIFLLSICLPVFYDWYYEVISIINPRPVSNIITNDPKDTYDNN